jgi:hypothetical protein
MVYRNIGAGACGTIFAQDGQSIVVKLAKADNLELWNDYIKHDTVSECFIRYDVQGVKVPECHFYVPAEEAQHFVENPGLVDAAREVCNLPTSALVTERIQPMPLESRLFLIDKYCSPQNNEAAKLDPVNQDCLVRIYLGSMRGQSGARSSSLRNFKMHLDQMVELEMDIRHMASSMGVAMAVMHWAAKTDARDVEFVLGYSTGKFMFAGEESALKPETYTGPSSYRDEDFSPRTIKLWFLDFNHVQTITMDEAGVARAIQAASANEPYLPKPLQQSMVAKGAWNEFVTSYAEASYKIISDEELGPDTLKLPRLFLLGLVATEKRR